jgi:hypothetical protein
MKPSMDHLLMTMVNSVATRIIPAIHEENYALGDAKMVAAMAIILAQEVDRAADVLIAENAALRGLFAKAAEQSLEDLSDRVGQAAASQDANYRVSTLEAGNAALRATLIDLHAYVEDQDETWANAIDAEIWAILRQGAERRMLHLPSM